MSQTVEKVRSKEDEEALDRKIAEIRKKNEQIARRKEEVDKDRELFVAEIGESLNSPPKQPEKLVNCSADTWKENVPEMGHSLRGMKHHSLWRSQQRGGISRGRGMRTRITPRSEFTLHDDRAEPTKPKKTDRDRKQRITSPSANSPADASQTKPPAKNDTVNL
ncbi:unnamed protein product, partial [Anisakis simplex]|uniref:CCDC9 n=1 Tax=Anisakis simplex TaxID=6269 RepID=A0A0M3K9P3_ANISI